MSRDAQFLTLIRAQNAKEKDFKGLLRKLRDQSQ